MECYCDIILQGLENIRNHFWENCQADMKMFSTNERGLTSKPVWRFSKSSKGVHHSRNEFSSLSPCRIIIPKAKKDDNN